jgi:hypothetical protein
MSPTSCRCSTPRRGGGGGGAVGGGPPATATSPTACKPQYPAALAWGTTGFGMGPGGATPPAVTGGPPPAPPAPRGDGGRPCGGRVGTTTRQGVAGSAAGRRGAARRTRGGREPRLGHEHPSAAPVTRRPPGASPPRRLRGTLPRLASGGGHLGVGFPLRCCQRLSPPRAATRRCRLACNRPTGGASGPVLSY